MNVALVVMAIWLAEGGDKTSRPYGIMLDTQDPRRVCENTVMNNWKRWDGQGCFLNFLADVYCPADHDPVGNRNWKRNVPALLGHDVCDCAKHVPELRRPHPDEYPTPQLYRRTLVRRIAAFTQPRDFSVR